ncbi:acyltransferase [sulfur-oxidizing endosymbiont of Gigantopelta aegis]|uniref:acyltransferase n=1 Tax=sulfur-oxidizing endosymbiont of Gigantopelta aegis TaxID=2794934 RepID=UPI0018DB6185|nr:acyltransferase [sulfur-oxidizing endosymbiont of Gigantopelta aegis]
MIKQSLKYLLNLLSQLLVFPLVALCKLEEILFSKDVEFIFNICTHILALQPGVPGAFLRRGFYSLILDECSAHCHIGFGTIFSHRYSKVGKHVYIGSYSIIGSSELGDHCLIGSRVSILSGKALHVRGDDGTWTPYSADRLSQVKLADNVWIGEGAIIAADVGEGSMVGAGSVVTTNICSHVIMAGNPARFVKKLDDNNT